MRRTLVTCALPLLSLAACGGSGAFDPAIGPPPVSGQVPTKAQSNLFDLESTATFNAIGAMQSLKVTADGTLYRGNASTVATPSGTISYNPRDGIFTLVLADTAAGVSRNVTFQDPAHRSTSDSARGSELQVPLLAGFNYLQAMDGTAPLTFFYRRPGTGGDFVSLAGFQRNEEADDGSFLFEQGAFVFGSATPLGQLPKTGTGRYEGQFLAAMSGGREGSAPVLQWIDGTSAVDVDFAKRSLAVALTGVVGSSYVGGVEVPGAALGVRPGSTFTAQGSAGWAAAGSAFAGKVASATFTFNGVTTAIDTTPVSAGTSVAGASSIDGTFYGPDAKNIGGNVRITGGVPDQRIDLLGAFTGTRK